MPDNQNSRYASSRKAANDIVKWYFDSHEEIEKTADKRSGPKFSDQQWAELLVEAISSFNRGLEGLEPDNRRASVEPMDVVEIVGPEAFNLIAFLVAAQSARSQIQGRTK